MKFMAALFVSLALSTIAHADQTATLTCTGERIILSVRSPYLGENSSASQELYALKALNNQGESQLTAYFLDVEMAVLKKSAELRYSGTNSVGGQFELVIEPWKDASDGTTPKEISKGRLSYAHGPMSGIDEKVECVRE